MNKRFSLIVDVLLLICLIWNCIRGSVSIGEIVIVTMLMRIMYVLWNKEAK